MSAFSRRRSVGTTRKIPSRRTNHRVRAGLRLEQLEPRRVLAGNMVKDIYPGPAGGASYSELVSVDGNVLFDGYGGDGLGTELWKSDGTARGTTIVKDINPGFYADYQYPSNPHESRPGQLTNVRGLVAFVASTQADGIELWRSDGTASGTSIVADLLLPSEKQQPFLHEQFTVAGGFLYFTLSPDSTGRELWRWFPSEQGAAVAIVEDISYGAASSNPLALTPVGDELFFTADDGLHGRELWKTDTYGASMVKDISRDFLGLGSSLPHDLVDVDGTLYFVANDGVHGDELWRSDGTAAGTFMLGETIAGAASAEPRDLVNVDGTLFFNATDETHGTALWKYNTRGRAGTVPTLVADINTRDNSSYSVGAVDFVGTIGNILLFGVDDGVHGRELWQSNGTLAGTSLVKDVNPGADGNSIGTRYTRNTVVIDDRLFFTAFDDVHGHALWITDGTSAGTRLVNDFIPGDTTFPGATDGIQQLTNADGTLFFIADDGIHGHELWSLDALRPSAGGGYSVPENGSVLLTAAASTCDPGSTITAYDWDLDYDGTSFDTDFTSAFPTATFDGFGIDGPAVRTVAVRIHDELGRTSIATAPVTITNVAPTASISGPAVGVRGQTLSFTLAASDPSSADMAAGFTYKVDFGDGAGPTTIPRTADNGTGDVTVSRLYAKAGTYTIRVTATDSSNAASPVATFPVTIAVAAVRPDPTDPDVSHLFVGGTTAADTIRINPGPTANKIRVVIGTTVVGTFVKPNGRVIVFGQAGDDTITVFPTLAVPAELHGDDGADRLSGGAARDILLGGKGADQLNGGAADDILVAGFTSYDADIAAWSGIFDEWSSSGTYAVKLANLLAGTGLNDPYLLKGGAGATVFNDSAVDILVGAAGTDAYFTSAGDAVSDLAKGETNTAIVGPAMAMAKFFAAAGSQPSPSVPTKTSAITSLRAKIFSALGQ